MPPKKRSAEVEEYDSDGGFVEDAPKSKKSKMSKVGASGSSKPAGGASTGKDGEVFWELSGKRRVGIQEFGGRKLINIREYYEKDGQMLPTKKGISLPIDQFNALIELLPQIETNLAGQGQRIERPDYGRAGASATLDENEEEPKVKGKGKGKRNFEETSEED
ncbi:hypothetical protein OEA41_002074 [Lepraria neglecta]|uniref:Transcriptional coactivator p15 (PC4) C-terminal domain-containing protein n=1 Tax=Lepraria neglecta TaxID=209136 RepID=A0AAE0DPL2_9LECA|nr:hypothetical protein OEA41_002074 [Lepraria neglecta]